MNGFIISSQSGIIYLLLKNIDYYDWCNRLRLLYDIYKAGNMDPLLFTEITNK